MTNTPPPPNVPNRLNLLAVIGVFVLAVIGVGFLVLAVVLLTRGPGLTATAAASPTHLANISTQVVLIPTTTQSPPTDTPAPTAVPPSATVPPAASDTPAASPTAAAQITIARPANVRTGPGLNYPTIGGINVGETAPAIGRDSTSQWFAISFAGGQNGTGWVSALVATYSGNINDLPVVQAAAPPPAATAVPATSTSAAPPPPAATNTPNVQGAGGIQTQLWEMVKTTGAPNESLFFHFTVVNNSGTAINYGILAGHTDVGITADSWHEPLLPGKVLDWKDHINFPNPGTYQVYLGICYDSHDVCKAGGTWVRLSNSITVTIQ